MSGEATVRHVELFIRRKMELSPSCQVNLPGVQLGARLHTYRLRSRTVIEFSATLKRTTSVWILF